MSPTFVLPLSVKVALLAVFETGLFSAVVSSSSEATVLVSFGRVGNFHFFSGATSFTSTVLKRRVYRLMISGVVLWVVQFGVCVGTSGRIGRAVCGTAVCVLCRYWKFSLDVVCIGRKAEGRVWIGSRSNLKGLHWAEVGGEVVVVERECTWDRGIPVVSVAVGCLMMLGWYQAARNWQWRRRCGPSVDRWFFFGQTLLLVTVTLEVVVDGGPSLVSMKSPWRIWILVVATGVPSSLWFSSRIIAFTRVKVRWCTTLMFFNF